MKSCGHKYGAVYKCPECIRDVRSRYAEFPLQAERGRDSKVKPGPLSVPWSVAEKAFATYAARYGTDQSVERLAERAGFSWGEMDLFYPEWREATDAWKNLELTVDEQAKRAADAEECRDALRAENNKLRVLLFHARCGVGHATYGDDGELQCSTCGIDFRRMSAEDMQKRFTEIGMAKLAGTDWKPPLF